jgi:hypothetical protein
MSILRPPRPSSNQSPEGFSWSIRISEKVLVTLFIALCSFASGFAYAQAQATSRSRELTSPPSATVSPSKTHPNTANSVCHDLEP